MDLILVGTSNRTAGVDLRGRVAAAMESARTRLTAAGVTEHFVLATCHRVELYAIAGDGAEVEAFLATVNERGAAAGSMYVLTGLDAVRHLCRVACGLDSMVIGEAEITGQIRRAAMQAREAGTIGVFMERVLAGALRASGRARSETRIGVGALSAASAAVSLVDQVLGGLKGRAVLVLGAGQAGRQALSRLAKTQAGALLVASRSRRHASEAADRHGAEVVSLENLTSTLNRVDAIIAASQAPALILTRADYLAARVNRPHFLVDLSVPRVVDPALAEIPGVTLRTVDDLGDIVRESTSRRLKEVPRVEAIVFDEARRAYDQFRERVGRGLRAGLA